LRTPREECPRANLAPNLEVRVVFTAVRQTARLTGQNARPYLARRAAREMLHTCRINHDAAKSEPGIPIAPTGDGFPRPPPLDPPDPNPADDCSSERLLQLLLKFHEAIERYLHSACERAVAAVHDADRAVRSDVLVVYGRNEAAREKVARYLTKLGLEPILLDEQAAQGRTLIEKLDDQMHPAFSVVLLTADDVGGLAAPPGELRPRARQNVILELGFCVGRFGRSRVSALYEAGVELPSDYCGVEYAPLDANGGWKLKLARELLDAGLRFDPLKAL
jgi:predicted nucleotide-binding protein